MTDSPVRPTIKEILQTLIFVFAMGASYYGLKSDIMYMQQSIYDLKADKKEETIKIQEIELRLEKLEIEIDQLKISRK